MKYVQKGAIIVVIFLISYILGFFLFPPLAASTNQWVRHPAQRILHYCYYYPLIKQLSSENPVKILWIKNLWYWCEKSPQCDTEEEREHMNEKT